VSSTELQSTECVGHKDSEVEDDLAGLDADTSRKLVSLTKARRSRGLREAEKDRERERTKSIVSLHGSTVKRFESLGGG